MAYIKPGTTASIGVLGDVGQVDADLTSFLKKVITEYGQSYHAIFSRLTRPHLLI